MATDMNLLEQLLRECGIERFDRRDQECVFAVTTERYTNRHGDTALVVVARLEEDGRYFKLFAPEAYQATGDHRDAFLRASMIVQWKTKLLQFEFDAADGEIRPIVEFPLEDANLTSAQLRRCLTGIHQILELYDPVFRRALETGTVSFDDVEAAHSRGATLAMLRVALEALASDTSAEAQAALIDVEQQLRAFREGDGGGSWPTSED